jgi:hypothetical protein
MCGRFNLTSSPKAIASLFDLPSIPDLPPRYNIAPSQPVPVVGTKADGKGRGLVLMRWGLVPRWWSRPKAPTLTIARADTITTKPSFKDSFPPAPLPHPGGRVHRVAPSWTETTLPLPPTGPRPVCLRRTVGFLERPFYGRAATVLLLYHYGCERAGSSGPRPNAGDCGPVRLRLLVGTADDGGESLLSLLRPFPAERMESFPISTRVNSAKNDGPELLEPVAV